MAVVHRRTIENPIEDLRRLSLTTSIVVLSGGVTVVAAVVGAVAALLGGVAGLAASAAAAFACLAGAMLALILRHALLGPRWLATALILGIMARMAAPLALAIACLFGAPALARAGLFLYLLIFYPVTLTIETWLSIPRHTSASPACKVFRPAAR